LLFVKAGKSGKHFALNSHFWLTNQVRLVIVEPRERMVS
jgi:hypothetical protein